MYADLSFGKKMATGSGHSSGTSKRPPAKPVRYKLLSTCTLGGHELRFLSMNEANGAVSFPVTVEECQGRLLFLGSDVLSSTAITRKNYIRVHSRYAKHGLATRLTLSGFKVEGINNSGLMWFYSIQGLFQVVFELHPKETQRDCITTLQDTWLNRYNEEPLKPTGLIRFHKRLKTHQQQEAHIDFSKGVNPRLDTIKSKLPLKKLVVVPDETVPDVYQSEEGPADEDCVTVKEEPETDDTSGEAGDFVERLIAFVASNISGYEEISGHTDQIMCQILLTLDYLKHISSEDVENFSQWGFAFFSMMEQYLTLVKSDMYEDSVDETFGLSKEKYTLMYVVSEWLGKEYHKLESPISKKVEFFKKQNLTAIDSLPPSESTIDMLFPSFMKQLLVCWLGAIEDSVPSLDSSTAVAFADHNYSPPAKVRRAGCNRPLFPLVQLILEFATDSLVSGVAHVVYSRLRYAS